MGIAHTFTEDSDAIEKEKRQQIEKLIADAKWNMYAEMWELAKNSLNQAKAIAVLLHDKAKIDETLVLLAKCDKREKVELGT